VGVTWSVAGQGDDLQTAQRVDVGTQPIGQRDVLAGIEDSERAGLERLPRNPTAPYET